MFRSCLISTFLFLSVHIARTVNVPSDVIELNERFLEVKDDGYWFVKFYAPWCAHCKRLMPTWEQVGHALADSKSPVRVGKLDCTRFTKVASALDIQGYPTVIFFRNGEKRIYEGERKKEAIVDFALKGAGPVVGVLKSIKQLAELRKTLNEPFFVYVSSEENVADSYNEYSFVASLLFWSRNFYRATKEVLSAKVHLPTLPGVVVFKDNGFSVFNSEKDGNLTEWIYHERWSLMPQITSSVLRSIGATRLLVLSVINKLERRNESSDVGKFYAMMTKVAHAVRADSKLSSRYQFGWLDGNDLANNIVLSVVNEPELIVFNATSYEYYLSGDAASVVTVNTVVAFLERIVNGEVASLGGSSIMQRLRRFFFEVTSSFAEMFKAQPMLTICIFGLPLAFFSLITYCLCSSDFSVDREDIYPEDEDDTDFTDSDEHQKAE